MHATPLFLALTLAQVPVPETLSYQGRLLKADGTPEAGVVSLTFALFDAPTGGTQAWSETQQVALSDGFYSVALGAQNAFPASLLDSPDRYLEVSVGTNSLFPRQKLASVPFALQSGNVVYPPNLLGNPSFETWQRGAAQMPDLWYASGTITYAKDTATPSTGAASALVTSTNAADFVFQKLENATEYGGLTMTASIDIKTGTGVAPKVELDDGVAPVAKLVVPNGGFTRVTLRLKVAPNAVRLALRVFPGTTSPGTVRIDSASLVVGSYSSLPFVPVPADIDSGRMLRFYEALPYQQSMNKASGSSFVLTNRSWSISKAPGVTCSMLALSFGDNVGSSATHSPVGCDTSGAAVLVTGGVSPCWCTWWGTLIGSVPVTY